VLMALLLWPAVLVWRRRQDVSIAQGMNDAGQQKSGVFT